MPGKSIGSMGKMNDTTALAWLLEGRAFKLYIVILVLGIWLFCMKLSVWCFAFNYYPYSLFDNLFVWWQWLSVRTLWFCLVEWRHICSLHRCASFTFIQNRSASQFPPHALYRWGFGHDQTWMRAYWYRTELSVSTETTHYFIHNA